MRWFQGKFSDVYGLNTKRFCRWICLWGLPYPFRKLTFGQISKRFGYTKLLERAADTLYRSHVDWPIGLNAGTATFACLMRAPCRKPAAVKQKPKWREFRPKSSHNGSVSGFVPRVSRAHSPTTTVTSYPPLHHPSTPFAISNTSALNRASFGKFNQNGNENESRSGDQLCSGFDLKTQTLTDSY